MAWGRCLVVRLLFVWQAHHTLARARAEQGLALFREQGDIFYSAAPLGLLGLICLEHGDLVTARPLLEESLAIDKKLGTETEDIQRNNGLAWLLAVQDDVATACRLYQESLTQLFKFNTYKESIAASLEGLGMVLVGQGVLLKAAWLWGKAEALR